MAYVGNTGFAFHQQGGPGDHVGVRDVLGSVDLLGTVNLVDADCSMQQWLEVGMGLKHQFGEEGIEVVAEASNGVEAVDKALYDFGMAMGPLATLDLATIAASLPGRATISFHPMRPA